MNVNEKFAKGFDIEYLIPANKTVFYNSCDDRLKCFIDALTARNMNSNDDLNFKSNVYENMLKARNSKFVSEIGIKEHMLSGKSLHASQVFSKQGAKGKRSISEMILKNSESVCIFKAPEMATLFFSFDNIQKLLKSHRIGGTHQKKVFAVIVCSILCLLPDGEFKQSLIQYTLDNCPAKWYSNYRFEPERKIFSEDLSTKSLKKCLNMSKEDSDVFNDIFENDLKKALDFVKKDIKI